MDRNNLKVIDFIKSILSEAELLSLTEICKLPNSELRQSKLRSFFHQPELFNKVSVEIDPSWLSYELFLNYQNYEF
jgi:hypothetical protein